MFGDTKSKKPTSNCWRSLTGGPGCPGGPDCPGDPGGPDGPDGPGGPGSKRNCPDRCLARNTKSKNPSSNCWRSLTRPVAFTPDLLSNLFDLQPGRVSTVSSFRGKRQWQYAFCLASMQKL